MQDRQWKILLVEDDEEDYLLAKEMLAQARGKKYLLEWVATYEEGKQAILSQVYDAILMDYELGAHTGLELMREVTALGCKAPIILLTGRGNYEIDMQAMQTGVADYLSKSEATPSSLERTIRYAILQKQTEEMLLEAKEELEQRVQERTRELMNKNAALQAEIGERERVEAELSELQRRLIDRNEAVLRELARDLHDGPMQDLYGLVFQMDNLAQDFANNQGEASLQSMKDQLLQVIQTLRGMSRDLRPPALAPYGLEKAIRSHIETIHQTHPNLKINLSLDSDRQALPEPVRMSLYRIYQTAISNVIRHAGANEVAVCFKMEPKQVRLEIQDDGCGFNVPARWIELARGGHMGLVGAKERAEAVGGELQVESAPGKGTLIRVLVPRDNQADNPSGAETGQKN
jgi:signal transduction histidine kinase